MYLCGYIHFTCTCNKSRTVAATQMNAESSDESKLSCTTIDNTANIQKAVVDLLNVLDTQ